jgi:hypothetical protein
MVDHLWERENSVRGSIRPPTPVSVSSSILDRSTLSDISLPSFASLGEDDDVAIAFRDSFSSKERKLLRKLGFLEVPAGIFTLTITELLIWK